MSQVKGIGGFGSTALLVSSMTGPGLSTIPALFQQSGWLPPVFIFLVIAVLSGCSALFVCEALSNIKGNEKFQSKVELTTIAQVYLGRKYHYVFQVLLYLALQAVNVTSIIIAAQTFDSMFITIFHGTCGLGVSPGGWFCVTDSEGITGNSPFSSDDYFIFTFGYLLTAVMVIPLGFFSLVENIAVQMISFIVLIAVLIQWCVAFCQEGLKPELLPAIGNNSTTVLGIVIFNYSFITTIPSWVNDLKPTANIHKCMWVSVIISTIFYIVLGILGAMAYQMDASSDILSILSANGSTASIVTAYLFPVCALITSIPVFTIVIRANLRRGQICNNAWAIFWSNFLPWFVCIPLQTKDYIDTIQNWSSLFFQSTVNFILPFILYFISRKYEASVEPITSEIESLDMKKSPIPHVISPSLALKSPDDNDVRMYNPDDNYSISIRRSSIKASKTNQMEGGSITVYPSNMETKATVVPTIVYSDAASAEDHRFDTHAPTGDPPMYTPSGLKLPDQPHRPSSTPSSYTAHSPNLSPNGLGISHPTHSKDNNGLSPDLPGLSPRSSAEKNDNAPLSPKHHISPNHNLIVPLSPEISQAPRSPSIGSQQSPSMIGSIFSFKSSAIAPEVPVGNEDKKENTEDRFIAFKQRKGFNPFYLALISCAALTTAIVFMIIYDLVLLGMGNDIFG